MIQLKLLSQTCNLILVTFDCEVGNLIVVRAVGAFLHRSELFGVAHLNVDSFKAMLSHQLIYQCYLIILKKIVRVPLSSSSSHRMMKILKDLDTDNWVHVKTSQLSSLYHSDAYLDQNYWNHDMTM